MFLIYLNYLISIFKKIEYKNKLKDIRIISNTYII